MLPNDRNFTPQAETKEPTVSPEILRCTASTLGRRSVALLAIALLVGLGLQHSSPAPGKLRWARSGTSSPTTGAIFNNPTGTPAQQYAIFDHINRAIDNAPSGSTIRMAVFSFAQTNMADRLIAAHRRGVHVKLIFDDHHVYSAQSKLQKALGSNPQAGSFVVFCSGACRGYGGNMHHKFFLFGRTGEATRVVMTGSNNITRHNAEDQWADLYTEVGNRTLYRAFVRIFGQMKLQTPVDPSLVTTTAGRIQAQFLPDPAASIENDPLMLALAPIQCLAPVDEPEPPAAPTTPEPSPAPAELGTVLRLSMHAWNGTRGRYLAERVAELKRAGCRVKVIMGEGSGPVVRDILANAGITPFFGTQKNERGRILTHQKVFSVEGRYGDNPDARIVWTGSHNWSNGALRRDDLLLRIDDLAVFNQYLRNFRRIQTLG